MIAVDSSVVIAALLSWHEFHERAAKALEKAMSGKRFLLPLPALIESYSVMTRLPSPHRLRPEDAHQLLHQSFGDARLIALSPQKGWGFLGACVTTAISGGRVYDALIALTALEAGARALLTFNPRDFEAFSDRLSIVVP